ncbi:hypothetical protein MYCTH_2085599 [Thermothelomyces thermophilus ATCC 42464]|uniref:Uncharacterized protein n=1 Tax=Thermothelomyces thermophilus (strain ATCC 42464 / BCRC 31852 / DSM 1799) TaxID=573729 RepID=G2PZQ6_THET4|nr:uncharacterized protein MYCTH_2085599 [Thermothelomyces thermophilus ATCC 42464]AEO53131.1 hypothetical protein MYCTH_2085599 [Thermothelomyces thermophilus ATCC 42464]
MAFTYRILRRPWRAKAPLYWGMVPELAGIVPLLVLFGLQQPDGFRSLFWRIGFENKQNSNPNMILYAYANYQPLPTVPFVWSKTLTNYNVAISILSLFILLAKMIATIMKVFYPIFGTIISLVLVVLYTVSIYGQAGPDYADPRYPSPTPWHLRIGCSLAEPYGAAKTCRMVQATLGVTVYLLTVYLCQLGFAIWAMLPNKELDMYDSDAEDDDDDGHPAKAKNKAAASVVQLQPAPAPAPAPAADKTPFTPRTQAFHALERKLPLRNS